MSATTLGSALTSNRVPHMNDMGRMMMLLNMVSVGVELANNPAATPRREKVTLDISIAKINPADMHKPDVSNMPRQIIMRPPTNPLMIPIIHLPKITEVICMGHNINSSKLEWNNLWITIFCDEAEKPEFIDDMAIIPGMTYAM